MKTISLILAALAVFLGAAFASDIGKEKNGVIHLTPAEAKQLIDTTPDLVVLDVRTRGEYADAHIDGAMQINYFGNSFNRQVAALDPDLPYLVHCRSGHRSGRAVRILKNNGIKKIYHLDGGMNAWKKAGLPVISSETENG